MAIRILDYTCVCAAGRGISAIHDALQSGQGGLRSNDLPDTDLETWIGRVDGLEQMELGSWQSRNNALAEIGLGQDTLLQSVAELKSAFPPERIGIVMGTSTSSIDRTETAYAAMGEDGVLGAEFHQPTVHNPHGPGLYAAHRTGITGPALTINTACSSSAKVFATAARWIQSGLVDAALVGGVDTLCLSVLYGFHGLQLVSDDICRPFDRDRNGINLGEAAGYAVLCRGDHDIARSSAIGLSGYGESSDAHHMSHPHPEGLGARMAMESALRRAGIEADAIGYINLHGTDSRANDSIEGRLVSELFPHDPACSSTKGWTGHTLGAAGIVESIVAMNVLRTGLAPANLNLRAVEEGMPPGLLQAPTRIEPRHVMNNSFGFGGNNCSLIFSRTVH